MNDETVAFEGFKEQLAEVVPEDEGRRAVALGYAGPRLLTFFLPGGPGRWLLISSLLVTIIGVPLGLISLWLLVATPKRLTATRLRLSDLRPSGETRSFDFGVAIIETTNNLWSGWLVNAQAGAEQAKYSVFKPSGSQKQKLDIPADWSFEEFVDSLPSD